MLDNPFLVLSLCQLNHISLCFIHISTKSPANCLFSLEKAMFFLKSSPVFGLLSKFQHNIMISIKTARVSRLSVFCDYDLIKVTRKILAKLEEYKNSSDIWSVANLGKELKRYLSTQELGELGWLN